MKPNKPIAILDARIPRHPAALLILCCLLADPLHSAELLLVENSRPRAEIVIAESPMRTVRLAAGELQTYLEKISGARLPIVTKPGSDAPVKIYVGRSEHTDRLDVTPDGLKYGAYRIVSGDDWLVLIGEDTQFTPIEPWARNNAEIAGGKLQREWDRITGSLWGVPHATLYKHRFTLPGDIGLPDDQKPTDTVKPLELWGFDERGSFNAVCGFLGDLGVRWYLPGELGEVLPTLKTISLPKIDKTVRPDFPIRRVNVRFGVHGRNLAMWAMRLGSRDPYEVQCAHGMDEMTRRAEIFAAHADWFALYGGKRQNQPDERMNHQLCYSNHELFQETVRNVRIQFDHYRLDAVSVMPPDGYTAICQCNLCEGKDSPERDQRGLLSDYVWDFVNRVAKEVRKTHPDKKILNCAYGVYTLPPLGIDKLEPNVVVSIVGGRRPVNNRPEEQEECRKLRESWAAKTDNPIIIFENYPFTDRGWYLPSFTPHSLGDSINATKGISQGEDIWLSVRQDFEKTGMGLNHFLIYFTQRMYWGGKHQDVDAMFREYCRLFYGPAEKEMLAFFAYCEANWQDTEKDQAKADHALALFAAARSKADPASVYGKRLALIDDYLQDLRNKSRQLGRKRGPVPVLRLVGEARGPIVIDGRLDDDAWVNAFPSATCRFRELQTGRHLIFGTTVRSAWIGNNVYFAFRCDEHPGEKLNIAATKNDDAALWYGDAVEVLLETESRSYYQIAVSPSGAVADLDRSAARNAWFGWNSQAEVATHVADDHWTVEMRIPVTQDENDPLHQVIGRKPTKSLPWHINLCRQRIRDDAQEHSAFSPTGADNFHNAMKFAYFFDGNSHQFEAAEPEPDFLQALRAADDRIRQGKRDEALAAYVAAAEGPATDLQKSHALEQAAATARALRKPDVADELAARIPIAAVQATVRMQNLLDRSQARQVIDQFSREDIAAWPFWKRGDAYFARGRAYAIIQSGQDAESDLLRALEWTSEPRTRDAIRLALAQNRENQLKDDTAALAAYREIIDSARHLGSADQFYALQGIARIQTRHGRFDEALDTLRRADPDRLRGFWRDSMLVARGDTLLAAGREAAALETYRSIINSDSGDPRLRKVVEEKINRLSNP
ncbi:MAG: tetratricopeptide repeat protein [Pirellulales bacterium]|nr:tetratricopeptide repeat protein [Pirellulales bacterium]